MKLMYLQISGQEVVKHLYCLHYCDK